MTYPSFYYVGSIKHFIFTCYFVPVILVDTGYKQLLDLFTTNKWYTIDNKISGSYVVTCFVFRNKSTLNLLYIL